MDTNSTHFTQPKAPDKPKLTVRLKQKGILRPYTIVTAILFGCASAHICIGSLFNAIRRVLGTLSLSGASLHIREVDHVDSFFAG